MEHLDALTPFDAALVFNHLAEKPMVLAVRDKMAKAFAPSNLEQLLANIANWFLALDADRLSLTSPQTSAFLRKLAEAGAQLFRGLILDQNLDQWITPTTEYLQVVAATTEHFLPVEYIYDFGQPEEQASLCERSEDALKSGLCKTCPHATAKDKVICPLGFWGLRRVVERHVHLPIYAEQLRNADFGLTVEPAGRRPRLDILKSAIMAASDRVDKSERGPTSRDAQEIANSLGKAVGSIALAETWSDVADQIVAQQPSLLLFSPTYVHG